MWSHPDTRGWGDEGASRLSKKKRAEIRSYLIDPGTSNPAKLNAEKIMGLQLMYAGRGLQRADDGYLSISVSVMICVISYVYLLLHALLRRAHHPPAVALLRHRVQEELRRHVSSV